MTATSSHHSQSHAERTINLTPPTAGSIPALISSEYEAGFRRKVHAENSGQNGVERATCREAGSYILKGCARFSRLDYMLDKRWQA